MLFLDFLQPEHKSGLEIKRFAVHMLPSILSRSSKSEELAKELKTHQVQHVYEGDILHAEKIKAAQAIKKYLKRRDLPSLGMVLTNGVTTSASQRRPLPVPTRSMQSMLASPDIMSPDERLRVYARRTKSSDPSVRQFEGGSISKLCERDGNEWWAYTFPLSPSSTLLFTVKPTKPIT
ncbi:hypothetical protein BDZ97DRAFT_782808 [Flammula alnicola]|nr:hypothetical protein BDZ97DRAFT_782808 [Flammula alnicola]